MKTLLIVMGLCLSTCTPPPTALSTPIGTRYVLLAVAGLPLPYEPAMPEGERLVVLQGEVVLAEDGKFSDQIYLRYQHTYGAFFRVLRSAGQWRRSDTELLLTFYDGSAAAVAVAGDTLRWTRTITAETDSEAEVTFSNMLFSAEPGP